MRLSQDPVSIDSGVHDRVAPGNSETSRALGTSGSSRAPRLSRPSGAPSALSDSELLSRVEALAVDERKLTAQLVVHLAEMESRRLYLGLGFPSLHAYCTTVLKLSDDAAFARIRAARALRRFPEILPALSEGSLSLTVVRLLSAHLTPENRSTLLAEARERSTREVERLIARHFPAEAIPFRIRRLPRRGRAGEVELGSQSAQPAPATDSGLSATGDPRASVGPVAGSPLAPPPLGTISRPRQQVSAIPIAPLATAGTAEVVAQPVEGPPAESVEVVAQPVDDAWTEAVEGVAQPVEKGTEVDCQRPSDGMALPGIVEHPPAATAPRQLVAKPVYARRRGRCAISPLSEDLYAMQLTVPASLVAKLEQARDLLGHQIPSGDAIEILQRALDLLIEKAEKRKFARTNGPRKAARTRPVADGRATGADPAKREKLATPDDTSCATSEELAESSSTSSDSPGVKTRPTDSRHRNSRYLPAAVRREVWQRDRGRCTFVGDRGRRCGVRGRIEFDHVEPHAMGGAATADNLRTMCRLCRYRHNLHKGYSLPSTRHYR